MGGLFSHSAAGGYVIAVAVVLSSVFSVAVAYRSLESRSFENQGRAKGLSPVLPNKQYVHSP